MMLRIRPVLLVLLVLALALPMRLHGLMAPPAEALPIAHSEAHPPCHGESSSSEHKAPDHEPKGGAGHASLHCATAGLVVPARAVDVPMPQGFALERLPPLEVQPGDGLAPSRQERPPRIFS